MNYDFKANKQGEVSSYIQINVDPVDQVVFVSSSSSSCPVEMNAVYSAIQDLFDEPHMMQHTIPISAQTHENYSMINGWRLMSEVPLLGTLRTGENNRTGLIEVRLIGTLDDDVPVHWEVLQKVDLDSNNSNILFKGVSPWTGLSRFTIPAPMHSKFDLKVWTPTRIVSQYSLENIGFYGPIYIPLHWTRQYDEVMTKYTVTAA